MLDRGFFFIRRFSRRHIFRSLVIVIVIITLIGISVHSKSSKFIEEYKISENIGSFLNGNKTIIGETPDEADIFKLYEDPNKGNDVLLTLVRNSELDDMLSTIDEFEHRFNSQFHYDWYFLNNENFTEEFKTKTSEKISGKTKYITIPTEYWSYPDHIDQDKAKLSREEARKLNINYGDSESYRFMCRFNSGFFYKINELENIDYYWRIEPAVNFKCDIPYDVFQYMRRHNKIYGFNMALQEDTRTIPTLWDATSNFFKQHPEYVASHNNFGFITDDKGRSYNLCHFWSNFEIAHLDFYRSEKYSAYFDYLEQQGGFFYERWGDAPVHTLAISYMLNSNQIHFVSNTGYYHKPNQDCPRDILVRNYLNCDCKVKKDFTWHQYSCVNKFFEVNNLPKPISYDSLEKSYPDIFESIDQRTKQHQ